MPMLLADAVWPARLVLDASSGRHLWTVALTEQRLQDYLPIIAKFSPTDIYIELSVNDWSRSLWTVVQFRAQYARLVAMLPPLLPGVRIWMQTAAGTGLEERFNANGERISDYRQAVRDVGAGCAACRMVDGLALLPGLASQLEDGVHPNEAGRGLYAAGFKAAVALP